MSIVIFLVLASTSALFGLLWHIAAWSVEDDVEVPDIPDYVHQMFPKEFR